MNGYKCHTAHNEDVGFINMPEKSDKICDF